MLACISTTHHAVMDLDVVGSWAVLSTAMLMLIPMLEWSFALRDSRARAVVRVWGILITIGMICSFIALYRPYEESPPCANIQTGEILRSPTQFAQGRFNCTYSCFSVKQPLRATSETLALNKSLIAGINFGRMRSMIFIVIPAVTWNLFNNIALIWSIPATVYRNTHRASRRLQ